MTDKIDCETAVARIKIFMDRYFEKVGRYDYENIDELRMDFIDYIDDVLDSVDIDKKRVVFESLELDKMNKS